MMKIIGMGRVSRMFRLNCLLCLVAMAFIGCSYVADTTITVADGAVSDMDEFEELALAAIRQQAPKVDMTLEARDDDPSRWTLRRDGTIHWLGVTIDTTETGPRVYLIMINREPDERDKAIEEALIDALEARYPSHVDRERGRLWR